MVKKRINKKNKKKLILIMSLLFLLSLYCLQFKKNMLFPEKVLKDISAFFQGSLMNSFGNSEVEASYDTILMEKEELEKENKELKGMLGLKNMLSDKIVTTANVINRNIGFFYDTITINKGSKAGIEEGMAVVVRDGLIGKTVRVSNYSSDIQLLTSDTIGKISVKIKSNDKYVYGLLYNYDTKKNIYLIEGISGTVDIFLGQEVTTTGMGDIFPSGILIGKVTSIRTDHFDLAQIIEVTPSAELYSFSIVSVLKRNVDM